MTLPQETIDKIKADAKHYMDVFVKGSVKYEDILPNDISDAHKAGATEWAGKAQGLVDVIFLIFKDGSGTQTTIDKVNKALIDFYGNQTAIDKAIAKYKEVTNG
jgi:hypothetical protein